MQDLIASANTDLLALAPILAIWQSIWPYLLMALGFSAIVFVHELGHFLVAKWADVRVERFAVGFGRELFGFTKGETRYSFNILPLGGYVKMLGQEDFDDKSNELILSDDPRSFANKPVLHRMAVVSAGVIMNVIFACLLFMIVFLVGMEAPSTRIGYVEPDSPADLAKLLPGDDIQSINGHDIYEFKEVSMAIALAQPHEPIEIEVKRATGETRTVEVVPDYRHPESTRDTGRQIVGIAPGVTREILAVGPEIDTKRDDRPHVGDIIVEVAGEEATDENANEIQGMMAYAGDNIIVERKDPANPEAPAKRVQIGIPPILSLYPADTRDRRSVSVLGLTPLVRFDYVDPKSRAAAAGIEAGDTVLMWDGIVHPSQHDIKQSEKHSAEHDIWFRVERMGSRKVFEGFVRPKRNSKGGGTIQAQTEKIPEAEQTGDGPKARFTYIRPRGAADEAGIRVGDVVLACNGTENPTLSKVNKAVLNSNGRLMQFVLQQGDEAPRTIVVRGQSPGSLGASYRLLAEDRLLTGTVAPTIHDKPSPAAVAGVPDHVEITHVNGEKVDHWHELIEWLRSAAGSSVDLTYRPCTGDGRTGSEETVNFPVPQSLRTRLGLGPEARILSIDGAETVDVDTGSNTVNVSVRYHIGTREKLAELVGKKDVPIRFRRNPLPSTPIETVKLDITEDMVDPWVARISLAPNVALSAELTLLQGDNIIDAIGIGIHKTYYFIVQVYVMMNRMIVDRSVSADSMSGPLGIIDIGGKIARTGFVQFLFFMAIISANLAVLNFLPLPIVDGGIMVFLIIEKIKGTPVNLKVQIATQMIGIFLLISAFVWVTYNDAIKLWG